MDNVSKTLPNAPTKDDAAVMVGRLTELLNLIEVARERLYCDYECARIDSLNPDSREVRTEAFKQHLEEYVLLMIDLSDLYRKLYRIF